MARIIYPEDFLAKKMLFASVKAKAATAAGAAVISAFLAHQGIDLDADSSDADAAAIKEADRLKWAHESEDWTQKRDLLFDPVMKNMRGSYQFLKSFYKPSFTEIGLWGAPVTATGKINYPADFLARTAIFYALKAKSDSIVPVASNPLLPYLAQNNIVLADELTATDAAVVNNTNSTAKSAASEDAREDRDNLFNPVMAHLRLIGGFLIKLYKANPKEVGNWGYTVDDSPRAPKVVTSKVKLSDIKVAGNCKVGGTFKNIGSVPLNVYKGSTATGAFVTVSPGEMYGLTKGFSTITVVNLSTTATGIFSVLKSR